MTLAVHRPYPGVALVVSDAGSLLLGAPTDAFKATKQFCATHALPFPRVLAAPQTMLVAATPQFNPEFFLYDFLFVYGAAFKPELAHERLVLVGDREQAAGTLRALRMTLTGPTREELASYRDPGGRRVLDAATVTQLATISEHMAIKKDGRARTVDEMVEARTFDRDGSVDLLNGAVTLWREGPQGFRVRAGREQATIDLAFEPPVVPFATLPTPAIRELPETFGVKLLGTRSGFDLSGPTTGFLFWLNGRALVYDGPVGTRYLLEHQGLSPDDVAGVILSHCHEDHMAAFVELILAGNRPRVFTTEPIYRSALVKLSSYFGKPEAEVASYVNYQRVTPGEPIQVLGATLDFFSTAHAIPTVGVRVSMRDGGRTRSIQVSGDTLHHEGLTRMRDAGVLTPETYDRLHGLIPRDRVEGALFFADVGEALIHGHPQDWQGNPNQLYYYHCPDNDRTRSFGHPVAAPGTSHTIFEAPHFHPSVPGRLLKALSFLPIEDPSTWASLLFLGRTRRAEAGALLSSSGETPDEQQFSVIVSGCATVRRDGEEAPCLTLKPGEFFGAITVDEGAGRTAVRVIAETPMEIFDIPAPVFFDSLSAAGTAATFARAVHHRPMVDAAQIFRTLDQATRHALAAEAEPVVLKAGATVITQGQRGAGFFLLLQGRVTLTRNGRAVGTLSAADAENFFGELSALDGNRPSHLTVRAKTRVRALRVSPDRARRVVERNRGVRYVLKLALDRATVRPARS